MSLSIGLPHHQNSFLMTIWESAHYTIQAFFLCWTYSVAQWRHLRSLDVWTRNNAKKKESLYIHSSTLAGACLLTCAFKPEIIDFIVVAFKSTLFSLHHSVSHTNSCLWEKKNSSLFWSPSINFFFSACKFNDVVPIIFCNAAMSEMWI